MRLIVIHNGETDSESRIYDTGDEKWPFEIHTPRGNWKVSDYPPALCVAHVAGKGVPRKPIAFRDVGVTTHGMPVTKCHECGATTENPYDIDSILCEDCTALQPSGPHYGPPEHIPA